MATRDYQSWGLYPPAEQEISPLNWRDDPLPSPGANGTLLPRGNGRSYGDVCLNDGGALVPVMGLDNLIAFDPEQGTIRCEAGILLSEISRFTVPRGWFLPVTPGTQWATLGGAVANDVHGKNHHRAGTLGCHVRSFELLRTDGSRLHCSPESNPDWYAATIGGMGLTGLIVWVELQLRPVANGYIQEDAQRFESLDEFFEISAAADALSEYTVAWVDCVARGKGLGRGVFLRGNHSPSNLRRKPVGPPRTGPGLPFTPPISLVNNFSLRAFNAVYYAIQPRQSRTRTVDYHKFFYPLDSIANWNRMYGPQGFVQYQCVVPLDDGRESIGEILRRISESGYGSFLAVLKMFGDKESPGMMSFPRPGVTLALDFPRNPAVMDLLNRLDNVTRSAGGAVYPAKDARMTPESFRQYFPDWEAFSEFRDPGISSDFWRRVTEE